MYNLQNIVPHQGNVGIIGLDSSGRRIAFAPRWLYSPQELSDAHVSGAIASLAAEGATDFYFTVAAFAWGPGVVKRRFAQDAKYFRSYAVDLDAHGKPGEYANPQEAIDDLYRIAGGLGIMPSRVVFTGRGIQAFWSFDKDLSTTEWLSLSDDIWSVLSFYGLRMDAHVHRDRARVLRLPGTVNSASGATASILRDEAPLGLSAFRKRLNDLMRVHDIPLIRPEKKVASHLPDANGEVVPSRQNEARLRWLLDRIPPSFNKLEAEEGGGKSYSRWRDVIWAIKRTGLPNAWQCAVEYAQRSARWHDDWLEGLENTWESDKVDRYDVVGPGTLVWTAQTYGRKKDLSDLTGFHFLSREELDELAATGQSPDIACFFAFDAVETPDDADETEDRPAAPSYFIEDTLPPLAPYPGILWTEGDLDSPDFFIEDTLPVPGPAVWIEGDLPVCGPDVWVEGDIEPELHTPDMSAWADTDAEEGLDPALWFAGIPQALEAPLYGIGAPGTKLPEPLAWSRDGWGIGLVAPMKGANKKAGEKGVQPDEADLRQFDLVCKCPLELVDAEILLTEDSKETDRYGYTFRRWNPVTGVPEQPFTIRGSDLRDTTALQRILGGAGVHLTHIPNAGIKMSQVLQHLIEQRQRERGNTQVLKQGGWVEGRNTFALGNHILQPEGRTADLKLEHNLVKDLGGYGESCGTLEGQKAVLGAFAPAGCEDAQAIMSMVLGSVLCRFLPNRGGLVYVYESGTATGKTLTFDIANSFFGLGDKLHVSAGSSMGGLALTMVQRNDLPTIVDDIVASSDPRSKTNEALRRFFLHSTQGVEDRKLKQSGMSFTRGDKEWRAPVFASLNVMPQVILPEDGQSVLASYARILVVPWRRLPFSGDRALLPFPEVNGVRLDEAWRHHQGHIGRDFIQWIIANKDFAMQEVRRWYHILQDRDAGRGVAGRHRYHNSAIACGMVAAAWLTQYGYAPGWDWPTVYNTLSSYGKAEEDHMNNLATNALDGVFTSFLVANQSAMVTLRAEGAMVLDPPHPQNARDGVTIRVVGETAYIAIDAMRRVCSQKGVEYARLWDWIKDTYPDARMINGYMNMTRGLRSFPRQDRRVIELPAAAVASTPEEQPIASAMPDNVVPIMGRA